MFRKIYSFFFFCLIACDESKKTPSSQDSQPKFSECTKQRLIGTYNTDLLGQPQASDPVYLKPNSEPQSLLAIHIPEGQTTATALQPYIKNQTLIVAVPSSQIQVKKSDVEIDSSLNLTKYPQSSSKLSSRQTTSTSAQKPIETGSLQNRDLNPSTPTSNPKLDHIEAPKNILSSGPTYEITFRQSDLWKEARALGWKDTNDLGDFRRDALTKLEDHISDSVRFNQEFKDYQKVHDNWQRTWNQYAQDQISPQEFKTRLQESIRKISNKAPEFKDIFLLDRLLIQEEIRRQYNVNLKTKLYSVFTTHWHKMLTTVAATMGITTFIYNVVVLNSFEKSAENQNSTTEDKEDSKNNDEENSKEEDNNDDPKTEEDEEDIVAANDDEDSDTTEAPKDLGGESSQVVEITPNEDANAHPVHPETGSPIPEISIPLEPKKALGVQNQTIIQDICKSYEE